MYLEGKLTNETREVVLYEVSLQPYLETLFTSCKICHLQNEKMSDYKTVSVSQSKNSVSFGVTYQLPTLSFKVIKRIPDSSKIHTQITWFYIAQEQSTSNNCIKAQQYSQLTVHMCISAIQRDIDSTSSKVGRSTAM